MFAFEKSAVAHVGMQGTWGVETVKEIALGFPMDSVSADIRQRIRSFLDGATADTDLGAMVRCMSQGGTMTTQGCHFNHATAK
jgi:hypothetical protein